MRRATATVLYHPPVQQWAIIQIHVGDEVGEVDPLPSDQAEEIRDPSYTLRAQEQYITQLHDPVYCLIVGQNISPRRCLDLQGQPQCFGCGAPSRLCEACRIQPLAFPEIELCEGCLSKALAAEEFTIIPAFPHSTEVVCPRRGGGEPIPVPTCREIQGVECGSCGAPSRVCQQCRGRPVHYPEYGLCLHCTVETFR